MEENENELKHYGVKGMRWGIRKNPSRTFAKASTHADKLKDKATSAGYKSAKYHAKTIKRLSRPSLTDMGVAKERRMQKKDAKLENKARIASAKSNKFERDMRKTFKDVRMSDISKEDLAVGRAYIDMLLRD